jgi:hypothetical protein
MFPCFRCWWIDLRLLEYARSKRRPRRRKPRFLLQSPKFLVLPPVRLPQVRFLEVPEG